MLNDAEAIVVLRTQLRSTQIVSTGSQTLAATKTGYTRATGSFITDGFEVGMELKPTGYVNNTPSAIKALSATVITTRQERAVEAAAPGRSLTVGIPSIRAWENKKATPDDNLWFISEDYLPGPSVRITTGPLAEFDQFPTYVIKLYGFPDVGSQALSKVARGVLLSFLPGLALDLSDGTQLRVRSDPAPYLGQILADDEGFAFIVVTIPLRVRTRNLI